LIANALVAQESVVRREESSFRKGEQIDDAIRTLESHNSAEFSYSARERLATDLSINESALRSAPDYQNPATREMFTQAVMEQYLFDVRDAKAALGSNKVLTVTDLDRYPLGASFTKMASVYGGRISRLIVESRPSDADILVDGQPKGRTDRVLVVSAGSHEVEVASSELRLGCKRMISTPASQTTKFKCP
jgi:hypothetical protein